MKHGFTTMFLDAAAPVAIGAGGIAALAWGFRALRGTTLRAPWWWAVLSLAAVALSETAIAVGHAEDTPGAAQLRLAAAATTFCPLVALLGAKRPQDRAWQFIVLSFWVILALPAAEAWLMRPGELPVVHPLWSWFLVVLVVVGGTNFLPTRFWLASLLAAAAQIVLLRPYLPLGSRWLPSSAPLCGLGLLAAAAIAAALAGARAHGGEPLDRLWKDFRDEFGVVWGLRVAERINAAAKIYEWDLRLGWNGFTTAGGAPLAAIPSAVQSELEASLRTLLRRFVSAEWTARRLASASRTDSPSTGHTGVPPDAKA